MLAAPGRSVALSGLSPELGGLSVLVEPSEAPQSTALSRQLFRLSGVKFPDYSYLSGDRY